MELDCDHGGFYLTTIGWYLAGGGGGYLTPTLDMKLPATAVSDNSVRPPFSRTITPSLDVAVDYRYSNVTYVWQHENRQ